jgi:nicotinamide-nucleotide amidase
MRVEVLAVGTELLLGQIVNTNAAWLGDQLAAAGADCNFHQVTGDNHTRIVMALRDALARGEGVIVCGGLGPTHDDITREAIAEVMNVPLVRDEAVVARIRSMFEGRGRSMPEVNARQADVPRGASVIDQALGTAPGLICGVGRKVIYALPGVPYEMTEMFTRGVLPDLRRRMTERGEAGVVLSRVLRTWGLSESALAELLQARIATLDLEGANPTIAFLASGMEGIKVRITAKAVDSPSAAHLIDNEEREIRQLVGDVVFGVDGETMESVVAGLLEHRGLTLAVAESLTGGMVASRLVAVPGASRWFRGGVVAYDSAVKYELLGVPEGPVVTRDAASAMAEGARRALRADVGLALSGVAGPDEQEGRAPGTVMIALAGEPGGTGVGSGGAVELHLPGDRERVRQYATTSALDLLRRHLMGRDR